MPIPPLDREHLDQHRATLLRMNADTPPRWGGLDAGGMLAHLNAVVLLSLGELVVPRMVPAWVGKPVGLLVFDVFTRWPGGRKGTTPPSPAICPRSERPFEAERSVLLESCERFVERRAREPDARADHPITGATRLARWSRMHGVHFRHHYRQFGVLA